MTDTQPILNAPNEDVEREVQMEIDNPEAQIVVMYPPSETSDEDGDTLAKSTEKQNNHRYRSNRKRVNRKSTSVNNGKQKPECTICGKTFSCADSLRLHMKIHMEKKSYICDVCGRAFRRSHHLETHRLSHEGKKPFICDQCGQGYSEKRGLLNHIASHYGNKNFNCDICGKEFWHKDGLRKHIYRVHENHPQTRPRKSKRSDECEVCGKTFVDELTLKRHIFIHTGEKEATCPICKKDFSRKSSLYRHTRRRHNPFRIQKKRGRKRRKKMLSESNESVNTVGSEKGIEQSGNKKESSEVGSKIKMEDVSSDSESDGSVDMVTGDHQHCPVLPTNIKKEFVPSEEEDTIPYCDSECNSEDDDQYSSITEKASAAGMKLPSLGVRVAVTLGPSVFASVQIKDEFDATGREADDEQLEPME